LGEEWAFEFEKDRLCKAGFENLAAEVVLHRESATARTPGWDITSFETLGDHLKAAIRYHFKTGHREAA
jgi:hypothetical protein